jgi:hypothetical protein
MPDISLTPRETDLVHAALSADRQTAAAAWRSWTEQVVLEEAPYPEVRLLPMAHSNLAKVAPDLVLPLKVRGKARATFARSRLMCHQAVPALRELLKAVPVIVTKGAAFCVKFHAWSFRQTGDVDIQVKHRNLARSVDILTALGWTPKYGMTPDSLKHRTPLRRNSWNLTRQKGDIDLHWRLVDGAGAKRIARRYWETAEPVDFLGARALMPSPEFATIGALQHGFIEGSRADALQALVDCWHWLPLCDRNKLAEAISLTGMGELVPVLAAAFDDARLPMGNSILKQAAARSSPRSPRQARLRIRRDKQVLHRPQLYKYWTRLGRPYALERLILRTFGPFSKPLVQAAAPRPEYDLRDCAILDEIGGPGWGWPEPEHTCFWSDQADNRLLVSLPDMQDYFAIVSFSVAAKWSSHPKVSVGINGRPVRDLDFQSEGRTKFALLVPRSCLFGPWIEFSFRPVGFDARPFSTYGERRSLPAVRLQIIPAQAAAATFAVRDPTPLQCKVDRGEEPHYSKFKRVELKIRESKFSNDPRLPAGFDPVTYVLMYEDLLNAEVDPSWHFIVAGQREGRSWF